MKQRLLPFVALAAALLAPSLTRASDPETPTAPAAPASDKPQPWYRPRHLVLQTAGGLGMVSAGAGYTYLNGKVDTDILLGYVPKKLAGSTLTLASAKLLYSPFTIRISEKWQVKPVSVGAYFSYTHGTLNDEERGQYTRDYYWWSSDTRYGPLAGGRVTYVRPPKTNGRPRNLSVYYDLSTNDLYLHSYLTNTKGLSIGQILVLGLGVKADF
ncbi:hypothetical protein [Hymenobacter cellulosivorans]|uniref:DUF3575 domain-containing protein n=1 Tax=Hymenobacter cellulosivorans TaxID=2932249 RepID=A0ABY4FDD6_9BACT|nr:hypothetical protein [Hymenobacter cellulosivorans]UOQ54072.1 hypothetical protein MUN80_04745 [Hymenobacter cellulosivorans]